MKKEKQKFKIKSFCFLVVFLSFAFLLFNFGIASAATLYFSPSSGSYNVGSTFAVSVYVSSADQAINAASGAISFPQDKLEAVSLSKSGSIFTLWVQEPSFFNSAGTVNFEGIALNPGFTGASGKLITVNFRVKAAGTAAVNFSSGSVLANDGKGTNILASLGNAQFSLGGVAPTIPESTTPSSVVSGAPPAPEISSPTHPDPNKWYSKKDAKFTWLVPSDVTAVRLLVGKIPAATPTVIYKPAISEKEVANIADGIWYFHAQLRNANGWGEISHFRFQIDTQPPEPFSIKFTGGKETDNPQPTVLFDTTDSLSGIDYYKIKIGEGDLFSLPAEIVKSNPYTLPFQAPGKKTILVQAFDKAGNFTATSEEFTIFPSKAPIVEIKESPLAKIFTKITPFIVFGIIFVSLLILLLVLIILFWSLWRKLKNLKKKLAKETREADEGVIKVFELLREDLKEQIKILREAKTQRELTREEEKILRALMKNFDDAEKFLKKEVSDIKRTLDT